MKTPISLQRLADSIGTAAKLMTAAPETAAERDRLKEKNEALYNALRKVRAELDWFKSGRLPVMDRCQKICEEAMDNNKH